MYVDVMNILNTGFNACSRWFLNVFNATGLAPLYLVFFSIYLVFRFLIWPVFGHAASDSVRYSNRVKRASKSKNNSSSKSGGNNG